MSQKLKIVLVVGLVLINAGLLVLLRNKMADTNERIGAVANTSTSPTAKPTSPKPSAKPIPKFRGEQGLAVIDDNTVLRYAVGTCDGATEPVLALVADTGESTTTVGLPDDIKAIFAVEASDAKNYEIIGADDECKAVTFTSNDAGDNWSKDSNVDRWFVNREDGSIVSPVGTDGPGCSASLSVSQLADGVVRAVCESGVVIGSRDGGTSWGRLGVLADATAVVFSNDTDGYALATDGECKTRFFSTTDAGLNWQSGPCVDADPARAIAVNNDQLIALAGDRIYVSGNDGSKWTRR